MVENIELSTDIETFILESNRLAMDLLSSNHYKKSLSLLRRAEAFLQLNSENLHKLSNHSKLLAITFNNFASFYKRKRQLNLAYKYLQQALKLELQSSNGSSIASTYLNLCAVLSSMSRHEEAKLHAEQAVNILENASDIITVESDAEKREMFQRSITLVIGLRNLGAELEHLHRFQEAIMTLCKGVMYGKKRLGHSHPLTKSLEDLLKHASSRYINRVSIRNETEAFRSRSILSSGRNKDSEIRRYGVKPSERTFALPSISPPKTRDTRSNSGERLNNRIYASFTLNESARKSPTMLSKLITSYRIDSRKGL